MVDGSDYIRKCQKVKIAQGVWFFGEQQDYKCGVKITTQPGSLQIEHGLFYDNALIKGQHILQTKHETILTEGNFLMKQTIMIREFSFTDTQTQFSANVIDGFSVTQSFDNNFKTSANYYEDFCRISHPSNNITYPDSDWHTHMLGPLDESSILMFLKGLDLRRKVELSLNLPPTKSKYLFFA